MSNLDHLPPKGEFLLYNTEDGETRLEVMLVGETVWLNQAQLAALFQSTKQNIGLHIRNIFTEGELLPDSVVKDFFTTAGDGKHYNTHFYNLDVIILVGYRIKSHRGTQFRLWATQRLREFLVKGFALDDERLKRAGGGNYFDELLARIRDIRASEKMFWRKALDIYATSIDYDPDTSDSQQFFATVQNKMHWAAHGHTAAEVVFMRADADQPNMGMTSFGGKKPSKAESGIAKNYLVDNELDTLNRIVTLYLEFAELQALSRKPMYMADWVTKLDDFLRISERDLLRGAGAITHENALKKAHIEFDKYRQTLLNDKSLVEQHFENAIKEIKKIDREKPAPKNKK